MSQTKSKAAPIILTALFLIYLIVLFKITIFRDSISEARNTNLIPFISIAENIQSILKGNKIIGISNLIGNIVIFSPLGYIAALLSRKIRNPVRISILAFAFSMVIETLQYILACGAADIDDIILNTLGGVVGYWLYVFTSKHIKAKKYAILISALMITVTCMGFFAFNNYRFLLPMVGSLPAHAERLNKDTSGQFTIDEKPGGHLSADVVISTDFKAGLTDAVQSNSESTAWQLILVNKWNAIPEDYKIELTEIESGHLVDKRIYPALKEMLDTARSEGIYPIIVSGYRTEEKQQRLMNEKIAEYGAGGYSEQEAVTQAEAWVAIPGTSEHQLGIAVDINADGINSAGYEVYDWLDQNSYKFGFIRRYPADKTEITGVINEPWHYRYVGVQAAAEIHNQGICLEEYLDSAD